MASRDGDGKTAEGLDLRRSILDRRTAGERQGQDCRGLNRMVRQGLERHSEDIRHAVRAGDTTLPATSIVVGAGLHRIRPNGMLVGRVLDVLCS